MEKAQESISYILHNNNNNNNNNNSNNNNNNNNNYDIMFALVSSWNTKNFHALEESPPEGIAFYF